MSTKRLVAAFLLLPMLAACFVNAGGNLFAAEANRVHNDNLGTNYASIQAAIDDPKTMDGHTILVDEGIYGETVVVHKSISLVGRDREKTQIYGGIGGAIPVQLTADGSSLVNFTVTGGIVGIFVDRTNDSVIANNTVKGAEDYAIYASHTGNCRIDSNIATLNGASGILITNSRDFVAINNRVFDNSGARAYGLNANDSSNGLISQNLVFDNAYDGIGLGMGTTSCTVCKNTVENNTLGIWVEYDSTANTIFQNNMVGNRIQAIAGYTNSWDNGLEGNFWGDYLGLDANFDGIDDVAHEIDVNNTDRYPLLGRFYSYEPFKGRPVEIVSNSSISDFTFFTHNLTMKIEIDPVEDQEYGFCRINIPHKLIMEPYNIAVTNSQPVYINDTLYDDGYSRRIFLSYDHSADEIVIQGHVPPDTDPPVISILSPQNATYNTSSLPLEFVVDEELSWAGYSLDTHQNVTVSGNTTLTTLSNGAHVLVLYAKDVAGNTGRSEVAFFIEVPEERSVTWIIAVAVGVAAICVVLLLYLRKRGRLGK
jgi:parallel beta-helix repeat protein